MSLSKSGIPYLTHVWGPVVGCTRGCDYCWARDLARRYKGWGCSLCESFTLHTHLDRLKVPGGRPKVIGLGLMTELFSLPPVLPGRFTASIRTLGGVLAPIAKQITVHPEHTFVTPTKCPEGIPEGFEPPENWWLLVTCTTQEDVDVRLPVALERWRPGRVVLNLEPLCGEVDCTRVNRQLSSVSFVQGTVLNPDPMWFNPCNPNPGVAGVILGGMSGPLAKEHPLDLDWARSVRDQCAEAGVPFALKQLSGYRPAAWPELDGRQHKHLPWRMP